MLAVVRNDRTGIVHAERLVRHGARPSAKTLISLVAAATIQLMCTHWSRST